MACLDENQVLALVHGQLSGGELEAAQEHLDSCVDCLDLIGFYQQSVQEAAAQVTPRRISELPTQDHDLGLSETEEINLTAPPGSKIGRYEVIRSLGRGGMGVVYLARDPELDRRVALKLVKPSLQSDERADHFEKRLMREARAMAKLAHPNVLTIYDVGIQEGQVFLASEWVDGCTLDEWMREGPHRWAPVAIRFREAAKGLVAAHAAGLIHRDFKPSNVMVGKDERVRVFDFGLVKATHSSVGDITTQLSGNFVVGTPAYMSPEQMVGKEADERSDQFSFCASLYEALAGVRPFSGRNLTELLTNIAAGKIDEPKRIPRWLWEMIKRGLKKKPEERHESLAVVLQILDRGLSYRRRRSVVVAAAVVGIMGLGAAGTGLWRVQTNADDLCGSKSTGLGDAWSEARRNAAAEGILASDLSYGKKSWDSASRIFDDYARQWQTERHASCLASRVQKKQSEIMLNRRTHCFNRLRGELNSVTSDLPTGSADVVRSLVAVAQGLSPVDSCSPERVQEELGPITDASKKAELEKLWPKVKQVDTLVLRGAYAEALLKSKKLLAQNPGSRQAEARLLASQGTALRFLGDYVEAVIALERSFYAAVAGKHDAIAARATIDIYSLLALNLQDEDGARRWRQLSESAVERLGSPLVLGKWRRVQGGASLFKRDLAGAEKHFLASLEIIEAELGPTHIEVANSLSALGRSQVMAREPERAKLVLTRALEIRSELLGPEHPDTATANIDLATSLSALGESQEAREMTEKAVATLIGSLGEEHPRVASVLNALAQYRVRAGDFEGANEALQQALRIKRVVYGASHPRLASTLTNLMDVDRIRNKPTDAIAHGSDALKISQGIGSASNSQRILRLRLGIAEAYLAAGDPASAQGLCDELQTEADGTGTMSAGSRGRVLTCLGNASLALGRKREGRELLQQAVAVFSEADQSGVRVGVALFALAKASASGSLANASQAEMYFADAGPAWSRERQEVQAWLYTRGLKPSEL